jgi:hypothetical protein
VVVVVDLVVEEEEEEEDLVVVVDLVEEDLVVDFLEEYSVSLQAAWISFSEDPEVLLLLPLVLLAPPVLLLRGLHPDRKSDFLLIYVVIK